VTPGIVASAPYAASQLYPKQGSPTIPQEQTDDIPEPKSTLSPVQKKEFLDLLENLSGTKSSIKAGKDWILEQAEHHEAILYYIRKMLTNEQDYNKKLNLIYLISDVLHHRLKVKDDELSGAILKKLVPILRPAYLNQPEECQAKVLKVLKLWESRNIFEKEVIQKIEDGIKRSPTPPLSPPSPPPITSQFAPSLVQPPPVSGPAPLPIDPLTDPNLSFPPGLFKKVITEQNLPPYSPINTINLNTTVPPMTNPDPFLVEKLEAFLAACINP